MKAHRFITCLSASLLTMGLLVSCADKESRSHGEEKEHKVGASHGHGPVEESPSGASFKAGKGVTVTEESKKLLQVQVADVIEQKLPRSIQFSVHVFDEKHHHSLNQEDHSGCDVHGSGFLSADTETFAMPGQSVRVHDHTNSPLGGRVLKVQKALALGETEIVIGISNATGVLKPGQFLSARIDLPRNEAVTTVPQSALLRCSEGTFVYVVNGSAYLRTPVKVGTEDTEWVEITDGLLTGDSVVTQPVETLWLIELRAVKGGGHCH